MNHATTVIKRAMQGRLTIDLAALADNYKALKDRAGPSCAVAAVIKANAYGCGLAACAGALYEAGAQEFFVATLPEAIELRTILGADGTIFMLGGFDHHHPDIYKSENIIPVLSSGDMIRRYVAAGGPLPAILHFDTGMNRLGLRAGEFDLETVRALDLKYIMSHFVSSDEAGADLNEQQASAFRKITELFPNIPASLSNSSGIFRSASYHFDMIRPGMALYGLNPVPEQDNPMRPVVRLEVPVLQIRKALNGETAGYNATYRFEKDAALAVVSMGYADGFLRTLSNAGTLFWNGIPCPVRGRVSMDLTIIDLCNVPEQDWPQAGDFIEVIGPNQSADDLAESAGTIGYEILTSLSRRYQRIYKN